MKISSPSTVIFILISLINVSHTQTLFSQQPLVQGTMKRVPDQIFKGQDTIYYRESLVWYSKELINSDKDFSKIPYYPDPYEPSLDVHLRLSHADSVKICYYDLKKNLLSTPFNGFLQKGDYTYHVIKSQLANGRYYVKCTIGLRNWVKNVSKLVVK